MSLFADVVFRMLGIYPDEVKNICKSCYNYVLSATDCKWASMSTDLNSAQCAMCGIQCVAGGRCEYMRYSHGSSTSKSEIHVGR